MHTSTTSSSAPPVTPHPHLSSMKPSKLTPPPDQATHLHPTDAGNIKIFTLSGCPPQDYFFSMIKISRGGISHLYDSNLQTFPTTEESLESLLWDLHVRTKALAGKLAAPRGMFDAMNKRARSMAADPAVEPMKLEEDLRFEVRRNGGLSSVGDGKENHHNLACACCDCQSSRVAKVKNPCFCGSKKSVGACCGPLLVIHISLQTLSRLLILELSQLVYRSRP